jgi:hypothetical protein
MAKMVYGLLVARSVCESNKLPMHGSRTMSKPLLSKISFQMKRGVVFNFHRDCALTAQPLTQVFFIFLCVCKALKLGVIKSGKRT